MRICNDRERIEELTRLNPFGRFEDGRPHVPDDLIERMRLVTCEEAWEVLQKHGYTEQFVGGWLQTHPNRPLVGRAVTAQMLPYRPDLHDLVQETGLAEGRVGGQNSWVIDTLQRGDVMVFDMFGKFRDGTVVGDNLATALSRRTQAGAVIDGCIRDYQGVAEIANLSIFCRGIHPSIIAKVTLGGINLPVRIGDVTVLPGDVVLGTVAGVIFIPPHLVQEVVEQSERTRLRDQFSKQRLSEGRYHPGEVDRAWAPAIEEDFREWLATR